MSMSDLNELRQRFPDWEIHWEYANTDPELVAVRQPDASDIVRCRSVETMCSRLAQTPAGGTR